MTATVTNSATVGKSSASYHKPNPRDFTWSYTEEPHASRRKIILAAHPEIRSLFVTEPLTFVVVSLIVAIQLSMAYALRDASWPILLVCAYVVGGTLNHSLQLAAHELSHNLCWTWATGNKLTAMYANFVTGIPSAITFQRYHMDHHTYQGVDGLDTDIPTQWEVNYFTNCALKVGWLFAQPIWYAFRPLFCKPKPFIMWEGINWVAQLSFDATVIYFFGAKSMAYLVLGTLLGLGLHPSAGHFIAEHYEFTKGQETYSYYGFWNFFNFNVGYHNEHHDFPRVPWTKLAQVKAMAPEFYDTLPHYTSYVAVMLKYIMDEEIGPFARIKRKAPEAVVKHEERKVGKPKTLSENVFKYIASGAMATVILGSIFFVMY